MAKWQTTANLFHEYIHSHGGARHVQYNLRTGKLYVVGEMGHGMDYFSTNGRFWWCNFTAPHGSPFLTFLLREATVEYGATPGYNPVGLSGRYIDRSRYNVLRLLPLRYQATYVNKTVGHVDYPDDFRRIPSKGLEFFLGQRYDQYAFIAVMADGIAGRLNDGEARGHGANRDNGVRLDIAFTATVPLPIEKRRWLGQLNANSRPYPTEHMHGF